MDITGKIIAVLPQQGGVSSRTGKSWLLQPFVIETQERFPRKVYLEIFGENLVSKNPVAVDRVVTISYDLESHEVNGRWFTSVRAWKVVDAAAQTQPSAIAEAMQSQPAPQQPQPQLPLDSAVEPSTDLPF